MLSGWEKAMDEPVTTAARPLVKLYAYPSTEIPQSLSKCGTSLEKNKKC